MVLQDVIGGRCAHWQRLRASFCALMGLLVWATASAASDFPNGFPRDAAFFPIGVWVQEPHDARRYKAMGINTYVGLWAGPTKAQLRQLAEAGMFAVTAQNEVGLTSPDAHVIKAWMQDDEPDNAQALPAGGYGDCVAPDKIVAEYQRLRKRDASRPVLLNFSMGVAHKNWRGRGGHCAGIGHDAYYQPASRGGDILSFDIYPVTELGEPEVYGKLHLVADGISNLVRWKTPPQRAWAIIGAAHIHDPKHRPTPRQLRAMAWMAIVNGARGLVYFVHEWQPTVANNAILRYPDTAAAVTALNAEIKALAPALNAGTPIPLSVSDASIAVLALRHDGRVWIVAVNLADAPKSVSIVWPDRAASHASVYGEGRTLHREADALPDRFAPYDVHIYEVGP